MAHAQPLEVVQAGGVAAVAVQGGILRHEAQVGTAPGFGHAAVFIRREVRHMHLPHGAGMGRGLRAGIGLPTLGRGGVQVQHHAPLAVGPRRPGIGVHHNGLVAVRELQRIQIVDPLQVPRHGSRPHPLPRRLHGMDGQRGCAGFAVCAGGEQAHFHRRGRGRPQFEHRLRAGPVCPQIVAAIIRQFTGLLPIHGHSLLQESIPVL